MRTRQLIDEPLGDEDSTSVEPVSQFDWDELSRRLGEVQAEDGREQLLRLAQGMRGLLGWLVGGDLRGEDGQKRVARRAVVLVWGLAPDLFETSPSLTMLADHLGLHKVLLSEHAAEFARTFGVRNRAQREHAHNFNEDND